jgi:hypothetical protein
MILSVIIVVRLIINIRGGGEGMKHKHRFYPYKDVWIDEGTTSFTIKGYCAVLFICQCGKTKVINPDKGYENV